MLRGLKSLLLLFIFAPFIAMADDFDFDDFAIVDAGEYDMMAEEMQLNAGSDVANVSEFDIAGIMLGMPFEDVYIIAHDGTGGLYQLRQQNSITYAISPDWKYNLDYECRQSGIYVPDALSKCIKSLAQKRGLLYASEMHLVRASTGETIDVYFTSNATENVAWRIVYNNDVDSLEGLGDRFDDQREKRILTFWQGVLDKYGAPNSGTDTWISTTNGYDPKMTAYYGRLDLVDMGANAADQATNVQQSRENFRGKSYAF
ncbi:MAG: hypothetical protein KBS86_01375 [Proteobacteria bacterium]|nr:hypothetical protein [Candidatus Enterousia scatequi]